MSIGIKLLLAGFTCLYIATPAVAADKETAVLNNQAVVCIKAGKFDEAIRLLKEALKRVPDYTYARENLAIAFNNVGRKLPSARAAAFFTRALEIDPENTTAASNLAEASQDLEKTKQQKSSTPADLALLAVPGIKLTPLLPGDVDAYARSDSFIDQGKYSEALQIVDQQLQRFPRSARYHYLRARCLSASGNYQDAIREFSLALGSGREPYILFARARAYESVLNFPAALADLNSALSQETSDGCAFNNRALLWMKLNRTTEAMADCNQAVKLHPKEPRHLLGRAGLFMELGKADEARNDYTKAVLLAKEQLGSKRDDLILLQDLGYGQLGLKEYQAALDVFTEIGSRFPQSHEDLANRAYCEVLLDKPDLAIETSTKAIRDLSSPESLAGALCTRGSALIKVGKVNEARADLLASVQKFPHDAKAYYWLSQAEEKLSLPDAAKYAKKAKELRYVPD